MLQRSTPDTAHVRFSLALLFSFALVCAAGAQTYEVEIDPVSYPYEDGRVMGEVGLPLLGLQYEGHDRTTDSLVVGDNGAGHLGHTAGTDHQFKSVVSFFTGFIPANATINSAVLHLVKGGATGTTNTLGTLVADIKTGYFGSSVYIQAEDFQSTPTAYAVATLTVTPEIDSLTTASLDSSGLAAITKAGGGNYGRTQLKLRFTTRTNSDSNSDYVGFYSANNRTSSKRPKLVVNYTVPVATPTPTPTITPTPTPTVTPPIGFTEVRVLNQNAYNDAGGDHEPRSYPMKMESWWAVWSSTDTLQSQGLSLGTDSDPLASFSYYEGRYWGAPFPMPSIDNNASDLAPDLLGSGTDILTDTFVMVWQSTDTLSGTIGDDYDILFSTLSPQETSWTEPQALTASMSTDSGSDEAPRLGRVKLGGVDNWIVVWQSDEDSISSGTLGTDYDILYSTSADGSTWTGPYNANRNAMTDSGDDLDPDVISFGDNIVLVWTSDENLGGTAGTDWDIFFATYDVTVDTEFSTPTLIDSSMSSDSGDDLGPDLDDGGAYAILAWHSNENWDMGGGDFAGTDFDIIQAFSMDLSTWYAGPLAGSDTDSGDDINVSIATDSVNIVMVWQSTEDLGSEIEDDYDIFMMPYGPDITIESPIFLNSNARDDSADDVTPHVQTDGEGNWLVVWASGEDLHGLIGTDMDILYSASAGVGPTPTPIVTPTPTYTPSPTPSPTPTVTPSPTPSPTITPTPPLGFGVP